MKKIVSLILCACLALALMSPAWAAPDFDTARKAVMALGIMTGDEKGNLDLDRPVTRAEFTKMMVAASVYRDSAAEAAGVSPFKDVKYTHWAAGYIKAAVDAQWLTGYLDGTFRPDNTIAFEEAASALLKMLGYTAADLSGAYPQAQIAKFRALKMDAGLSLRQGQLLKRSDCVLIFYNLLGAATKSGAAYAQTLGYALDARGEIDLTKLIQAGLEGPYVVKSGGLAPIVPFDLAAATVYRNNKAASAGEVALYDVVYYHKNMKTVWAYSDRAAGTITAVSPNAVAPETVTVSGVTYPLGTSEARSKVSTSGQYAPGDTVLLLLGMNGEAVDILPGSEADGNYLGVVTRVEFSTLDLSASSSRAGYLLTVACTDGVVRQFMAPGSYFSRGDVVSVSLKRGGVTVQKEGPARLAGAFSLDGAKLGSYRLAEDVEILEVTDAGGWKTVSPARLAGATLSSGHVRAYQLDGKDRICRLVLADVTGDLYSYGVVTTVSASTSTTQSGWVDEVTTYACLIDGVPATASVSGTYNAATGGAVFSYDASGKISGIKNLTAVSLDSVGALTAASGNRTYTLADSLQVYIRGYSAYTATKLTAVTGGEYRLTGYCDSFPAGGQIRVIVAEPK